MQVSELAQLSPWLLYTTKQIDNLVQLQNSRPHQRTLDVAATGCAKYMRNNLNETVREELFIRIQ